MSYMYAQIDRTSDTESHMAIYYEGCLLAFTPIQHVSGHAVRAACNVMRALGYPAAQMATNAAGFSLKALA